MGGKVKFGIKVVVVVLILSLLLMLAGLIWATLINAGVINSAASAMF